MTARIYQKITGVYVKPKADDGADAIEQMHEKFERPEMLTGSTYKIKTPLSDHALYITINDVILNAGTDHETRRPFEIFINSKNMEHFQWVVALTRVISAVFRKGGDVTFLVEELKAVFDPQGGYFKSGGRFMPSLVAEIGDAIEAHMKHIGLITPEEPSEYQKQLLQEKRKEYEDRHNLVTANNEYPSSAELCLKCHTKAVIVMDGCKTCLSCGNSKCG
ncbi:NrdJb [Cellvibrio sp. PSBB006]|uniref:TSCPD domain-containing protein n=1 Tax=Cellvibrio sp. PSBB006 TaxID=1987723 RepID=UPI000B3B7B9A|nr:NrdJb [Cellvibrio sp. PSBB006]